MPVPDAAGDFWKFFNDRIKPRLRPDTPDPDGSTVIAVGCATDQLGATDPDVVQLERLYQATVAAGIGGWMN